MRRLLAVARVSQDSAVRAEAVKIDQLEALLRYPADQAAREGLE